jgi:hypothetical protein
MKPFYSSTISLNIQESCVVEYFSRSIATPPVGTTCCEILTFLAPNEHLFDYIALPII